MANRAHIVAAFGASEEEFRTRLVASGKNVRCFRFGCSGKWQWANASVWLVNGSDIDHALLAMSKPAIRVTSSDGILWMLTLTGGGEETFRGVHHFACVGHLDDEGELDCFDQEDDHEENEPREIAGIRRDKKKLQFLWDEEEFVRVKMLLAEQNDPTKKVLDEFTGYGVVVSDSTISELKKLSGPEAYKKLYLTHTRELVERLQQAGIPFNTDQLFKLLTVGPLTTLEEDSDLGNMRRFLLALGIDGVFADSDGSDVVPDVPTKGQDGTEKDGEIEKGKVDEKEILDDIDDAKQEGNVSSLSEEMMLSIQEAVTIPHREQVVWAGKSGNFYMSSMSDLTHIPPQSLAEVDRTLKEFGFQRVADMACDADQLATLNRVYVSEIAIAVLGHRMQGNETVVFHEQSTSTLLDMSDGTREFQSHFADGSTLVTNNMETSASRPKVKIFARSYEHFTWSQLWRKHLDGIDRMKVHRKTELIDHSPFQNPRQCAKQVDKLIIRFIKAS